MDYRFGRQRKLFLHDCDNFHPSQASPSAVLITVEQLSSATGTIDPRFHPWVIKRDALSGQRPGNHIVYSSAGKIFDIIFVQNQDNFYCPV